MRLTSETSPERLFRPLPNDALKVWLVDPPVGVWLAFEAGPNDSTTRALLRECVVRVEGLSVEGRGGRVDVITTGDGLVGALMSRREPLARTAIAAIVAAISAPEAAPSAPEDPPKKRGKSDK